jgi:hypothetical protein
MAEATDAELLGALRHLLSAGAVSLEIDAAKLNHMDSPVAVESEVNRWLAAMIAACGGAFWLGGWIGGAGALALSVLLWFAHVRRALRRRVERRVHARALGDVQTWRKLWRFGGVRLVAADAACAAPAGNWMQFVRERRPP